MAPTEAEIQQCRQLFDLISSALLRAVQNVERVDSSPPDSMGPKVLNVFKNDLASFRLEEGYDADPSESGNSNSAARLDNAVRNYYSSIIETIQALKHTGPDPSNPLRRTFLSALEYVLTAIRPTELTQEGEIGGKDDQVAKPSKSKLSHSATHKKTTASNGKSHKVNKVTTSTPMKRTTI